MSEELKIINPNKLETNVSIPGVSIGLQLGDIIRIKDDTNKILNNQIFFIDYIDTTKIKLINIDTLFKTELRIQPDKKIDDGSITQIDLLKRNKDAGFAKQNNLNPNTWVTIYFGGDIPLVITGKITNLEEDMIEVTTIDGDVLYINFDYKGIPEDLPIEYFQIRLTR